MTENHLLPNTVDKTDSKDKAEQEEQEQAEQKTNDVNLSSDEPQANATADIDPKEANNGETRNLMVNDGDNKSNDDVISELSTSVKDELYEQAETEAVEDESVKDMDLSLNADAERNTNESAESEQQVTALEMPQTNDNDSIESKPNQIQLDSLDILVDSLDASLEPSVEADSLNNDSLEDKTQSAKSNDDKPTDISADNAEMVTNSGDVPNDMATTDIVRKQSQKPNTPDRK